MMLGEITQSNLYLLLPSKVSCIAHIMQEYDHKTLNEAFKTIYASKTYKQLEPEDTKCWHLGPADLYRDIMEEQK